MSFGVTKSTQFKVKELTIVTKDGSNLDIREIYEELNIHDSLFMPIMSGSVLIKDSIGLSSKLLFDGSEALLIEIVKDENSDIADFKKAFRIYGQTNRINDGQNSETYLLKFASDELIFSDQQRINQSYEDIYSEIIKKILSNYLKVPENQLGGTYDKTVGIRKIVVPNLRPLEAIEWCAKRSVDASNSPNFLFFQNITGYNFASLTTLVTLPEILDIKFEPKNTTSYDAIREISSARTLEVVNQTDNMDKTRSGVNAAKFIGFDPITRIQDKKNIGYMDHYNTMKHENENPNISVIPNRDKVNNDQAFDSKKVVSIFGVSRQLSNYIKKYEPESLSKIDNYQDYKSQRTSIIKNLMSKRVKLTMPGNFQLSSGFMINLMAPNFAKKEQGDANEDKSLSGKYLIIGTRHVIGYEKHETIIEIATTSSGNEFVPVANPDQTSEILEY